MNSTTDVRSGGSGKNVDNRDGVDQKGPIVTIIPDINRESSPLIGLSDFTKWNARRHDSGQSEEPVFKNVFKNYGREKTFEVEKVEHKNLNSIYFTYSDSNQSE